MSLITTLPEFRSLGCRDQTTCAIACRVYLNLLQDTTITNLRKSYDDELGVIFLHGDRAGVATVFVPQLACHELDLLQLQKIQSKFTGDNETKRITLAICDPQSTVLYYNVTPDFVEREYRENICNTNNKI